ncbi:MAG TPA: VCBS repeat-containing protein [Planctomycetota bacterium]|jgi:hypothetical protein
MIRVWLAVFVFAILAALPTPVGAIINQRFTPVHLVREANVILHGTLAAEANGDWEIRDTTALKGKSEKANVLRSASFKSDQIPELRRLLQPGSCAILFAAAGKSGESESLVHINGRWISAKLSGVGKWDLLAWDRAKDAVYAGGTDMLVLMTRYIIETPGATVPVSTGMMWNEWVPVTKVTGQIAGLAAVQYAGRTCIFIGSPEGDQLFAARKGGEAVEDVTPAAKLACKSRQFAWLDMDGDGVSDLVSWDGAGISIQFCGTDGFMPDAHPPFKCGSCLQLAPAGMGPNGKPRLLISTSTLPLVLDWTAVGGWTASPLPESDEMKAKSGEPVGACIVADLNGDGFADVLQPRASSGWLWLGGAQRWAAPIPSPVACPGGAGPDAVGDFNGDGALDIYISASSGGALWENDGKAGFRNVIEHAGSLGYKAELRATAALAADLNHDGRPDLALGCGDAGFALHFNRGFRCFGEQGELRLNEVREVPVIKSWGVEAMAIADFNSDDADDLAVAFPGGEVHCYYSSVLEVTGVRVRLGKAQPGPITVSAWQGGKFPSCMGTWLVNGHDQPRLFSLREKSKCELRYVLPGGKCISKQVDVGGTIQTITLDGTQNADERR